MMAGDKSGVGPEGVPVTTITLEITGRCYRQCVFCYRPEGGEPAAELSAAELIRHAGELLCHTGCKHVQLSGGEPLLRDDLLRIVEGIGGLGARVSVITDAGRLDAALARRLKHSGVSMVQPTLMAAEAELHDSLRGAGSFRQITRGIAAAAAADLDVSVCLVVTKHNHDQAAAVAELCFALGGTGLALSRFCPTSAGTELLPSAEQVRSAVAAAARICRGLSLPLAAAVTIPRCVWPPDDRPPLALGTCSLVGPTTSLTVGPDGGVRSCCLSRLVVGNLRSDPWELLAARLWDQQLRSLRDSVPDACRDCRHVRRCLGGCRLSAEAVYGCTSRPDPLAPRRQVKSV